MYNPDWHAAEMQSRLAAVPAGRYKGRPIYRVPVTVAAVDTDTLEERCLAFTVKARSAADAANHVRDMLATVPCVNITAIGPAGGVVRRYIGWESAIGARLLAPRAPVQLDAFEEVQS
jgi:hypothetical protein